MALKQLSVAVAHQALTAYNDPPFLFEHGGELVTLVAAAEFLDQLARKEKPFFLYLPLN